MHRHVYGCEARSLFLPIKGILTWGRFTVYSLRTTVMLSVNFDLTHTLCILNLCTSLLCAIGNPIDSLQFVIAL